MRHQWTKFDEFKFQFGRNMKAILVSLVLLIGLGAYILDVPVHKEYVAATISGETYSQRETGSFRVVAATLDSGQQIRVNSFSDPQTKVGAFIRLDKRTSSIFGRRSYHFVEYLEEELDEIK